MSSTESSIFWHFGQGILFSFLPDFTTGPTNTFARFDSKVGHGAFAFWTTHRNGI